MKKNINIIEGSGGCFPENATITTPFGNQYIKDLKIGDRVIGFNVEGITSVNTIVKVDKHHKSEINPYTLNHIKHEKGVLVVTSNHNLLTSYNGFKEADDFSVGEYLTLEDGNLSEILSIKYEDSIEYVYNLTTTPDHTFIANGIRVHNGGGGKEDPHTPVEDENTLQSKAVARIIDVLCEGEIEGFYEDVVEKSIFFDRTPLKDSSSNWNISGVTTTFKSGLPDQDSITGFPNVETEVSVSTELTVSTGPVTKTITDLNIDDVRVLVSTPRLANIEENGDIKKTSVSIKVRLKPDGGNYTDVKTIIMNGKCIAPYQRSYLIQNIGQYGDGPWTIQLERITEDSGSSKLANKTYWVSYTSTINEKMIYPNTALLGIVVDSEQFGNKIPSRAYDIKGLKLQIPDNYTVSTREYSGSWTGTFKTEWCNNPAWVYYDLLTNERYGMGLSADTVDKWALYTIAQYCDTYIDDGFGETEPRFVCNLVINTRKEAIHVLNILASVFRGMPLWAAGQATIIQDRPKDTVKLVTAANVINGEFNYEGSGLRARHTVAKVTWNDISDFCRRQVEYVEDSDGVSKYGWRPIDVYAYGTTSRGQAHRVGKWILDSELNETEVVQYKASFDQADVLPGDIVEISDPHYTGGILHRYSGRIVDTSAITITIDNSIKIESGKDYTLSVVLPDGSLDESIEIINAPGDYTVLETAVSFSPQPQKHSIWMVTVSDLAPRKFRILSNIEDEKHIFNITGLYYDENKFARIEGDIYLDEIATSAIPIGQLLPPTSLTAEEFQYFEGGSQLYGTLLSWSHPDEPRKSYYDVQSRTVEDGIYIQQGKTINNSYEIRPVTSGTVDYRVRTVGAGGFSVWCSLTDFSIEADNTTCSGVENLQVLGGGTSFSGPDCEIEWDNISCHILKRYKVEVYKIDDTLLRTDYPTLSNYDYTYQMNADDNSNTAIRDIKFKVSAQNIYDRIGPSETLVVENAAPTMDSLTPTLTARYGGITIDWDNITPSDNDMWKYKILGNTTTPPTTIIHQCDANTTYFNWYGLDVGTTYYLQIEPYDKFGAGTKSNIVNEEPVLIPDINVDTELQTSIAMSDSDSNDAATLALLYDRNKTSDGVSYTVSGTNTWIEYKYAVEDLFDRVIIYTADANAHAYVSYSSNGTDWNHLSGEADHTLNNDGELVTASGTSEAETNYWQTVSGTNIAIFPAMVAGRYMRLYMTGSYTTIIYELVFYREIVAEMAAIDNLAALSANMGTLTAGVIQSSTYGADEGILIDLDNDRMIMGGSSNPVLDINAETGAGTFKGVFTFESSTTGYSQITDKPTDLGDINATEGTKLDGIAEGADVTASGTSANTNNVGTLSTSTVQGWAHASDTTKIDGGDIYTNTITADEIAADTITASQIAANTITADEIASDTITANEINVSNLAAINADLGTITAGNITMNTSSYIRGGQTGYYTGTGFFLGYSGGAYKFSFGDSTKNIRWDGTDLTVTGKVISVSNFDDYSIGDRLLIGTDTERSHTGSTTMTKKKEIFMTRGGPLRIKFTMRSGSNSQTVYGRIYRNGTGIGTLQSNTWVSSATWQEYSQDISGWTANDLVQLYIAPAVTTYTVYIKDFRIYVLNPGQDAVVLD